MSWGAWHWWWLAPVVMAAVIVSWLLRRRMQQRQASLGFGNPDLIADYRPSLMLLRSLLWTAGLLLLVLAALQPRWGEQQRQRTGEGVDLVVVLDCSRSMLAEDIFPDRLEVARRKVTDLLRLAPEHRIALVPFAAEAVLRSPLTGDANALEMLLEQCRPELFTRQGSAIGDAVSFAVEFLAGQGSRGQAVLICSDGDDPNDERVAAGLQAAQDAGIPVYGLFVGDETQKAEIMIDGQVQAVASSRATLDDLARETGALALNTSLDDEDITLLLEHMRLNIAARPWQEEQRVIASERYQYLLLPGILCLLLALLIHPVRRHTYPAEGVV